MIMARCYLLCAERGCGADRKPTFINQGLAGLLLPKNILYFLYK